MSKMKAVVLEKIGSQYTVLGMDGAFRQVKRINAEVGEEIELNVGGTGFWELRVWIGVAALFLMILTSFVGWNLYQAPTAVALVSVDINPSLEFTLDSQGRLLELRSLNEDARQMLGQNDLKGKPIDEVLEEIVSLAYNQNYINPERKWIVVGYSSMTDKELEKMPMELNGLQIGEWITETIEKKGFTPQVAVFALTPEDSELAHKGDLTIGEFALWQTAQKAGVTTEQKKLKDTSERVRLLENPQVQALVKAEKKALDTGLPRTPGTSIEKPKALGKPIKDGNGKHLWNASRSSVETLNFFNEMGRKPKAEEKKLPQEKKIEANKDNVKANVKTNEKAKDSIKTDERTRDSVKVIEQDQESVKDNENYKNNYKDKYKKIKDLIKNKLNYDKKVSEKERKKEQDNNTKGKASNSSSN